MVGDGASTHKIEYVWKFNEILNLEGHQNCTIGSRVMGILLKGDILPIGVVASGRVCAYSLHNRLATHTDAQLQIMYRNSSYINTG